MIWVLFVKSPVAFLVLLFAALTAGIAHQSEAAPDALQASSLVEHYANDIYASTQATGMAMIVIDANQRIYSSRGVVRPGSQSAPQKDSVVRIASLTKLLTSELLVKMSEQGVVSLHDPLNRYAPAGKQSLSGAGKRITLLNLATHTSGLPREQPGGKPNRPVFVWPTFNQRWNWFSGAQLKVMPGTQAAYSNVAFDLLGDALSRAGKQPYPVLLKQQITRPLGMKDTTFTPSPDQCRRLMIPAKGASPCMNTLAAIGSGGLYSTPDDMGRWMQQFLSSDIYTRTGQVDRMQTMIYQRPQLNKVEGMDVPGKATALGLGWVYMAPEANRPGIIQKTGGGGGFITYIAMAPQYSVGVFIVVSRSPDTHFKAMSDGVHGLITELIGNSSGSAHLAATLMAE
ncbi:MAG: D-alanyl-D-alanine-carboxypeptidase/endopeptidaseAmpH [Candidatus Erwinia impunctatus]|nr:D-alanyl-D-alanine-carboxypeptidase/endopeptidaseAmpH [Culicoides impunctatus]